MDKLVQVRDKVLERAALRQGERLLDVGAGEGWIGFGAFGRGAGEVVFSDISGDVLDACREAAEELGVADRCKYIRAAADDLSALEEESVDVVTTRSVLIYVAEKQLALREFFRVLRPGGRMSLSSPSTALRIERSRSRASGSALGTPRTGSLTWRRGSTPSMQRSSRPPTRCWTSTNAI